MSLADHKSEIRHAAAADIQAMIGIASQSLESAQWTVEQYQQMFAPAPPRRVALVIATVSTVQGFLVAREHDREWELENIAISLASRSRGFGFTLLSKFLAQACGESARRVFLEVRESNWAARRLYEKCSFVAGGRRKNYYTNPLEDALTYLREWH